MSKRILSLVLVLSMVAATCLGITPNQSVQAAAKPKLNKTSVDVLTGKSAKLKLKKITGAKVKWKSQNKKIATVNKSGKIKGIKKGNTKVTASVTISRKTYRLNCKVRVIQKAKKVQITYDNGKMAAPIQLKVGQNIRLNKKITSPKKSNDFVSSWKSSNKKVAAIDKKGNLTALKEGTTTITVTTFGKAKASIKVKVEKDTITPTAKPTIVPTTNPTAKPSTTPLYSSSFESGQDGFGGRTGTNTASRVNTTAYDGSYSLYASGREAAWHGVSMNATNYMKIGNKYFVRGYVKQDTGFDQTLKISLEYANQGRGESYPEVAEKVCKSGEWTLIEGYVEIEASPSTINLYFEMPSNGTASFYVDMVSIWWDSEVKIEIIPPDGFLKEAYKDLFTIGTAVTSSHLLNASESDKLDHVLEQYNSITMENEMKPEAILRGSPVFEDASFDRNKLPAGYTDEKVPKLNFSTVDKCLSVVQQKGLKMRGHTLIWHSQTPTWFFKEDYSSASDAKSVSISVMNARMEFYIKTVLEHVQTEYPGVIYAWDVCNEVFTNDGAADYAQSLRGGNPSASNESSNWYNIYKSDEFVINAFTYAKRYRAEGVTLFYNDYNEYMPNKTDNIVTLATKLHNKGIIDGIGMQSHIDVSYPSVNVVETAIEKFAAIGNGALEIQLTELDVTINFGGATGGTLEQQTKYYSDLMKMVVKMKRAGANVTNVTLWGFYDEMSWRSANKPLLLKYYPSLGFTQKGGFKSVLEAPLLAAP